VATIGGDGSPHVAPLWFVWHGAFLWLNSLARSPRWTDLPKDPRLAIVVEGGEQVTDPRGAEARGTATGLGHAPPGSRPGVGARPVEDELLRGVELSFARKYAGRDEFTADGRHAWLRITPQNVRSWDFGKIRRSH